MTKEEIIKAVWNQLPDLTLNEAKKVYEMTMKLVVDTLAQGETVEIRNFGKFSVREKNLRIGRNPRTGQEAEIRNRRVVTFKPSKNFKGQILNGKNIPDNVADNEISD